MEAIGSRLSSPRFQRRLMWIGGIVLVVGASVFGIVEFWGSPKTAEEPFTPKPAQIQTRSKTVKLDPEVRQVGEQFIRTAVARKQLEASWELVAPTMKNGFTLKQWKTGAIPIIPYPADTSRPAPVKIDSAYAYRGLLEVLLIPRKGVKMKPQLFLLGLRKFGQGADRHWLVEYWAPFGAPKVPSSD
jgi:hypothetical protein